MGSVCGPGCESRLRTVLEIRPAGGRPEPPGVGLGRALPLYGVQGCRGSMAGAVIMQWWTSSVI